MNVKFVGTSLLLTLAGVAAAADQPTVRAVLQPAGERKAAPEFALKDGSGKTVSLEKYRGKVVLLDFWATWCHGCKLEIPWFSEFERKYSAKGLSVVGVSLDDEGWKVVKPFIEQKKINYPVVLGDDKIATLYGGFQSLPTTLVIDKSGRIVSARVGLVKKSDYENEIITLLNN